MNQNSGDCDQSLRVFAPLLTNLCALRVSVRNNFPISLKFAGQSKPVGLFEKCNLVQHLQHSRYGDSPNDSATARSAKQPFTAIFAMMRHGQLQQSATFCIGWFGRKPRLANDTRVTDGSPANPLHRY